MADINSRNMLEKILYLLAGAIVGNKYNLVCKIHNMKLMKVTFFILNLNY